MEIKIIRENGEVKLAEFKGRHFMLMPKQKNIDKKIFDYKEIKIHPWGENDEMTFVEFYNVEYIEELFEIVSNKINNDESLENILKNLANTFAKERSDLLKLRGDLGEALFALENGGDITRNNESFDIFWKDNFVEVKSYSPQKKTINISDMQLNENTLKFAVEIKRDQDGITILDLANKIKQNSPDLSKYLSETYREKTYLASLKFAATKPFEITGQLPKKIDLPSNIVNAHYEIKIDTK